MTVALGSKPQYIYEDLSPCLYVRTLGLLHMLGLFSLLRTSQIVLQMFKSPLRYLGVKKKQDSTRLLRDSQEVTGNFYPKVGVKKLHSLSCTSLDS